MNENQQIEFHEKIENSKQNLDDSFENKCIIDVEKKILSEKAKISPAEDDKIDIAEYDKIVDLPITFPFELDVFQKRSIIRLEKHQVKINYFYSFYFCIEYISLCSYFFRKNRSCRIRHCIGKKK